jgi:hypothetical protein
MSAASTAQATIKAISLHDKPTVTGQSVNGPW